MRLLFVFCFVASALAVMAPAAKDAELIELSALAEPLPTTSPVEITVLQTPSPTPTPPPIAPEERIFAPSRPVAPIPVDPAPPTPEPTPEPAPEPEPEPDPSPTPEAVQQDGGSEVTIIQGPNSTSTPSPTPVSGGEGAGGQTYTREEVRQAIRDEWGGDAEKAIRVATCESSLNPRAYNPAGPYYGLWQFHIQTWRNYGGVGDPRDQSPAYQTKVAWRLFSDRGWAPWPWCSQNT